MRRPSAIDSLAVRRLGAACLLLAIVGLAAGCAAAATPATTVPPSAPSGSAAAGSSVTIANFAFAPASLTVAAGTTVTWTNTDAVAHTVTADDGSFSSQRLASGSTFAMTFPSAGTYAYHCAIHSSMTATIVVH